MKSSVQRELDRFYKILTSGDFNIREVSKGAFTQARANLNPWAFKRLNEVALGSFYDNADYLTWDGKRLLSIDGTWLQLPNHPSIKEEFGVHKMGANKDYDKSMAIGSMLYDVFNLLVIDAQLAAFNSHELHLAKKHVEYINENDLILADRGYGCIWFFFLIKSKGADFCIRLKENGWKECKALLASGKNDRLVTFELPRKDYGKLEGYNINNQTSIKCRLVKIVLDNGQTEILCTSLLDSTANTLDSFKELYNYRWNQEEAYKMLKSRIEIEQFSGKTAKAVKQDFYSKALLMTLCAIYAYPIEEKVREEYKKDKDRKYDQKINRTSAMAVTREILPEIFLKNKIVEALTALDKLIFKTREIIRPKRKNPRIHRNKKPFSSNYKNL